MIGDRFGEARHDITCVLVAVRMLNHAIDRRRDALAELHGAIDREIRRQFDGSSRGPPVSAGDWAVNKNGNGDSHCAGKSQRRSFRVGEVSRQAVSAQLASLTTCDYHVTMKARSEKTVRVAALKARLSEYLRAVRRGHPVVVYDRDTPVARLVPYESAQEPLSIRRPIRGLREVILPRPVRSVDSLTALLEERQASR